MMVRIWVYLHAVPWHLEIQFAVSLNEPLSQLDTRNSGFVASVPDGIIGKVQVLAAEFRRTGL